MANSVDPEEQFVLGPRFSLNVFYFNLVRYTYKYIQVTECKRIRIRTKARS